MAFFKMAKLWICLLLLCVLGVNISLGADLIHPQMQHAPLLNFGTSLAGDNEITSFDAPEELLLKFNISYFGSSYNKIYISSDGLISFVPNVRFLYGVTWSEGIRNSKADRPFLAPFYHEAYDPVSVGYGSYHGKIYYRVIYGDDLVPSDTHFSDKRNMLEYYSKYVQEAVINPPKDFKTKLMIIVTWEDVTDKASQRDPDCDATHSSKCKASTFQAVLIADEQNTFAMFNYLKMDVPYQTSYQSGFNGGYERGWFDVIPCHGACSVSLNKSRVNDLPNLTGSDHKGRYFLNIGGEEIVRGGCLPTSLRAGMLEVYPQNVGMFGGEKLEVSGKCLSATSQIYCKFGKDDKMVTTGVMTNDMKGYCPVPLLTTRGPVMVSWSSNGKDWTAQKEITVVLPGRVKETSDVSEQVKKDWYSRDSKTITVEWDPEVMSLNPSARVNVKLIGYRETGNKVEFKELENFGETQNSAKSYTFTTDNYACTKNCKDFEMGLLEVGLAHEYYGDASDRVALRFGPIPLGWYANKELTDDMGSDWSDKMCRSWYNEDKKHTDWLKDLPKCPCSLDQVLADFGRWQAAPGCSLFTGSKCHYHKTAKHCVRSIQPTSKGAGNQCCYHNDGTLMYSQLSYDGSTPDRGHSWGASPYDIPDHVPSLSHWKHDVVPFYHCCLWNDYKMCDLYTKLRPTQDCALYEVPGLAIVRGDPHITTFDGQTYQFGGMGDFFLLDLQDITIQGRFEHRMGSWDLGKLRKTDTTSWKPTALTHLILQGAGQKVEVHPAPVNSGMSRGVNIRVGNNRHFFLTESTKMQDFRGQLIINNALSMDKNEHNNFTIITNNVGVNVFAVNNLLHVTVALPPSMKHTGSGLMGMGLLGMFDGNHDNDYVSRANTLSSPGVDPKKLYEGYAMSWAINQSRDSLFPLEMNPSKFASYFPFYTYNDIPHDFDEAPSDSQISGTCGKNDNCKWDYRITGNQSVAQATKAADELFGYSQGSAYLVENCGLPAIGQMAKLNSYNFSAGEEITVTGCGGDKSFGGEAKFACVMERLDVAEDKNRDDYGRKVTDNQVQYIVHWVPEPSQVCGESSEDASMAMIIGIVVGVVVVIIIIIVIVVIVMKKRKGKENIQQPRAADRVRKDRNFEDGTDEPMMDDRRPVYKPNRKDPPASSAV